MTEMSHTYSQCKLSFECIKSVLAIPWGFWGYKARGQQWLMQDGTASHIAKGVPTWSKGHNFEDRVISHFKEHSWAPHSPD